MWVCIKNEAEFKNCPNEIKLKMSNKFISVLIKFKERENCVETAVMYKSRFFFY